MTAVNTLWVKSGKYVVASCRRCSNARKQRWREKKRKLAMLGLLFLGCTHPVEPVEPEPVTLLEFNQAVLVSDAFPPAERAEIDAAFGWWLAATGGSALFSLVSSPGQEPWRIERGVPWRGMGSANLTERVITIHGDAMTLPDGLPMDNYYRLVVAHELGHALTGPGHVPGTLMAEHLGDCLDAVTVRRACEKRGCAREESLCDDQ